VLLAAVPALAISGAIMMWLVSSLTTQGQKAYAHARWRRRVRGDQRHPHGGGLAARSARRKSTTPSWQGRRIINAAD
jgi:hypothetical protein